jgi:hypothetical protein
MNMTLKFHFARRTAAATPLAAKALTSTCVAVSAFVISGFSMAQQAPQKVQTGPGTAVVASWESTTIHPGIVQSSPGAFLQGARRWQCE